MNTTKRLDLKELAAVYALLTGGSLGYHDNKDQGCWWAPGGGLGFSNKQVACMIREITAYDALKLYVEEHLGVHALYYDGAVQHGRDQPLYTITWRPLYFTNLEWFIRATRLEDTPEFSAAAETAQHYEIEWGKHVQLYRQLAQDVLVR